MVDFGMMILLCTILSMGMFNNLDTCGWFCGQLLRGWVLMKDHHWHYAHIYAVVLTLLLLVLWLSICPLVVYKMLLHSELWVLWLLKVYWFISRCCCASCIDVNYCSNYSQFCSWIANLYLILNLFANLAGLWTCLWSTSFLTGRWGIISLSVLDQCHWQISLYMNSILVVLVLW